MGTYRTKKDKRACDIWMGTYLGAHLHLISGQTPCRPCGMARKRALKDGIKVFNEFGKKSCVGYVVGRNHLINDKCFLGVATFQAVCENA